VSTLRRLFVAAALAARPALPLAAAALTVTACGGKSTKKVKKPTSKADTLSVAVLLQAARAAAAAGDVATADAKYREAEKAELTLDTVKEHVALLVKHDRAADAVGVAKGYYEAKPSDSNGSLVYANALISAGEFATAIEIAGEVVDLQGTNPAGFDARGRALVGAGRADEGLEDLRKAVELAPQEFEYQLAYGIGLEKAAKVDEAALTLRSALKLKADEPRALMHLGIVRRAQFEVKEGVGYLMQAVRIDPNLAEAWFNLAIAQNDMGDNVEAENSASKATALAPHVGTYAYVYGEMLRINKKVDEAKAAYQKALDATPPHPKAAVKLALVLYDAGQYAEAEVFLTDMLGKDPGNASLYYNLGWVYSAQKKYKLGVDAFEKYLSLAPKDDSDRGKANAEIKSLKKKGGIR